ncbi:unnamed protein product [Cylicocyclus nassatus]|uniref:Uncharacterized protein n=1 Tax=Cylicocyclus nassatus TaxID=53992 RepID=A0AA36MCE9_CYLNA|nr:unnamed protein product [Cylicocyclus nassatus]
MVPLAALSLSITIFSSVAMTVVHRRDAAKLRDLESMTGYSTLNYTLSMKFQLAENVRVTRWLTYSSLGYAVWAFIGALFAFPPLLVFSESELIGQLLHEVLNVYFAVTFAIVIWLSLAASGELRHFLNALLPLRNRRISNALYLNTVPLKSNDSLIATELYFTHLKSAWGP